MRPHAALAKLSLVVALCVSGTAQASSSANYSVPASMIAAGGGASSAASWRVRGMIAGGLTGESVSAHYAVRSGPWAVLDGSGAPRTDVPRVGAYLPLVRRGS